MRLLILFAGLLAASLVFFWLQSGPAPAGPVRTSGPPNILMIVIDDMGFNDLGANGSAEVHTPNLDRLAQQGVRFTRNYVNSTCTVTRAGILTGLEPSAIGFRPLGLGISPEVVTLPESLRAAGYRTHHIGKWHVGYLSTLARPLAQGYDTFFGFLAQNQLGAPQDDRRVFGNPTYRDPWLQHQDEPRRQYKGHLSRILTDHTVQFLSENSRHEAPWFLSLWTYAPHSPVDPMSKFAQKYPKTPEGKYLAFIEQVDDTVGRVVDALDRARMRDNTLVMVVSDNGGNAMQFASNLPFKGKKGTFYEGGVRTPLILRWPGELPAGKVVDEIVSYLDYFPTLATVAGADIPAEVIGHNLLPVAAGQSLPRERNLYWQSSNGMQHSWSVLSANGQWRLGQYFIGDPELVRPGINPGGDHNVYADYPEIVAQLRGDFLAWSKQARVVPVNYQPLADNGRARLEGATLDRVLAHGGHTFAIAVTPHSEDLSATGSDKRFIAYQLGQWQLYFSGGRLRLDLNGIALEAPLPAADTCSSIIVSTDFVPGHLRQGHDRSHIDLWVNGALEATYRSSEFLVPPDNHLHPTYIGQDESGEGAIHGQLGRPLLLNVRLVEETLNDGKIENGVHEIEQTLCQAPI